MHIISNIIASTIIDSNELTVIYDVIFLPSFARLGALWKLKVSTESYNTNYHTIYFSNFITKTNQTSSSDPFWQNDSNDSKQKA